MSIGAGKYDDASQKVLLMTGAQLSLVIVIQGDKGNGFSVSTQNHDLLAHLPAMLRHCAQQIDEDVQQRQGN